MSLVHDTDGLVARALVYGIKAHENDKWGVYPYSTHLALAALEARRLDPELPELEAAAWLHDVVEDHPELTEEVKELFPTLFDAIVIVSRKSGETYREFIQRVIDSNNALAIRLKFIDMTVNLGNDPNPKLRQRYEENISRLQIAVQSTYQ